MNNQFISPINFSTKNDPVQLSPLPVAAGDFWRFLLRRHALLKRKPEEVSLELFKPTPGGLSHLGHAGHVRQQTPELYTEFSILLSASTAAEPRQFALELPDGKPLFDTFYAPEHTPADKLIQLIAEHFEAYPFAAVICQPTGPLLTVRMYHNERFKLKDTPLAVRLGSLIHPNTNSPAITTTLLSTKPYPERTRYKIAVSSVQPGNVFTINDSSYTAIANDTAETVLNALVGQARTVELSAVSSFVSSAMAGSRVIINKTAPSIIPAFQSTDGTYDYYSVRILGTLTVGNYLEVTVGNTTVRRTVLEGDTLASVTALFNPNNNRLRVPANAQLINTSLPGQQLIPNENKPTVSLVDPEVLPAQTYNRYRAVIQPDVREGNRFFLQNQSYTAKANDTALDVAKALGCSSEIINLELPSGEVINLFAIAGYARSQRHTLPVSIIDEPRIASASQYVAEVSFPEDLLHKSETVFLGITEKATGQILSLSNPLSVDQSGEIVVFGCSNPAFGFDYLEPGLLQRMRLPIYLRSPREVIEDQSALLLDGRRVRMNSKVSTERELVSLGLHHNSSHAIASVLAHETLIVNELPYSLAGAYSSELISEMTGTRQIKASLTVPCHQSNYDGILSYSRPLAHAVLTVNNPGYALTMFLRDADKNIFPLNYGQQILPTGEYTLEAYTPSEILYLGIYENDDLIRYETLPALSRIRSSIPVRLISDINYIFDVNFMAANIVVTESNPVKLSDVQAVSMGLESVSLDTMPRPEPITAVLSLVDAAKLDIEIYRGDDIDFAINFPYASGRLRQFSATDKFALQVRNAADTVVLNINSDDAYMDDNGNFIPCITISNNTDLVVYQPGSVNAKTLPGTYRYDLQVRSGFKTNTLLQGAFTIQPDVTR